MLRTKSELLNKRNYDTSDVCVHTHTTYAYIYTHISEKGIGIDPQIQTQFFKGKTLRVRGNRRTLMLYFIYFYVIGTCCKECFTFVI